MAKNNAQTINKGQKVEWPPFEKQIKSQTTHRNNSSPERNFDLLVDGVPYAVRSIPFLFNNELRFRIILNGASEHVFTRDSEIGMLRAINDDSSVLPAGLEEALSEKLQGQLK